MIFIGCLKANQISENFVLKTDIPTDRPTQVFLKAPFRCLKTAALISASNLSDYQLKQLRTACNKELGNNPFASAHKVSQARNNLLSIDKDDWTALLCSSRFPL